MNSDFRDRISIAVWAVMIVLAAGALISLPGRGAPITFGSFNFELPFAAASLLPVLLALVAAAGTQAVVSAHPLVRQGRFRLMLRFAALPVAISLITAILLPRAPSVLYWGVLLLGMAGLLAIVLFALYVSLDWGGPGYRRARTVLNLAAYGAAVAIFLLIPATWPAYSRALILGGTAWLLALELLRGTRAGAGQLALYSLIVGAVIAQVAWGLLLIGLHSINTSVLLLLIFYLMVGMIRQTLLGRITRRVIVEYLAVGGLGLLIVLLLR
ncbi:MAG: hypothetical protein ABTQ73_08105 [Caldilineales bacterium]